MDTDKLFINSIDDIYRIIKEPNEYDLLRSTLLVRQLLLDGNRLVNIVNRKRKLKIIFQISNEWESKNTTDLDFNRAVFIGVMEGLHPSLKTEDSPVIGLSLSKFIKFNVFYIDHEFITIQDVISHCAHIMGGVHVGKARTEKEKLLSTLQVFKIKNTPIQTIQLIPILMVVRDGLTPLYEQVKKERKF